jgi:APA family basic amino acid/polyamine antiporter
MKFKKDLSSFDITAIVIGSIIGADIYITPGISAGLIGPFSIIVWVIAGGFAVILALVFAYSSHYVPKVGGPFAIVSKTHGNFSGFLAGWSMLIAEMMALPIFAIVFTKYLGFFVTLDSVSEIIVKGLFIFSLTAANILGVKIGGRVNDTLTIIKLAPLFLVILSCVFYISNNPEKLSENYSPLIPLGLENLGIAIVLIFWAYAGFEMATLPAGEIKNPRRIIPKAIGIGVTIVILFYLTTNFVLYGSVNWIKLSESDLPLVLAGTLVLGYLGGAIVSFGAMSSVSGASSSFVLGIARLYYAMSEKGLFPKVFSKTHTKFKTPYVALIIQGTIAFILSIFSEIIDLISFSVFNMAFMYSLVCLSLLVLKTENQNRLFAQRILSIMGIGICGILIFYTSVFDKIIGSMFIVLGVTIYLIFYKKSHKLS